MFKCKLADAVAIALALAYTGSQSDPAAVKAFLIEKNPEVIDPATKSRVDFKTLEIETEAKSFTLPLTPSAPAAAPLPPADEGMKLKAMVADELKRLGVVKPNRPGAIGETQVGTVKSAAERLYDVQAKAGKTFFADYGTALACKHWLGSKIGQFTQQGDTYQHEWKRFNEVCQTKAYDTTSTTGGSATVPDLFIPDVIKNVLDYGAARKIGKVIQMGQSDIYIPRRTGGLSMTYPTENSAGTASNATYDNVTLHAKTGMVLCQASRQILDDTGIPLMEEVMDEIARCIATQEDNIFFTGNGSSTYAGMTGFEFKYGATATDGGYVVVGGATADAHTDAQVNNAFGRLPQYARKNAVITCSPQMNSTIFGRLAQSSPGGLTFTEIAGMGWVQKWRGVPIIENNSMSSVTDAGATNRTGFTAGDQIDFLIGDFARAALIGDRLGLEVEMDPSPGFTSYSVYIRGIIRHDIVVHSVGTSTTAGPVVSFWQT